MDLVYKFRELYGADMYVGLSPSRMFYPFPWIYRADSYSMDNLDVMQAVTPSGPNEIPATYPDGDKWLEETLESAPDGSITLMWVAGTTPLQTWDLCGNQTAMAWRPTRRFSNVP